MFLKLAAAIATGLAILPLLPAGQYLLPPLPFKVTRQRIGSVQDPLIAQPNTVVIFWYPTQADPEFTNLLIHLPEDLAKQTGKEYVAFNRTCLHLRCLVSYLPGAEIIGCPCHGSLYRPTDGLAVGGPAKLIGRALPEVELEIDANGDIFATNLRLDLVGYGREP
jgi:ubiquinol-cytochrome c reductase iron-sulfur subunit